jgi:hypothetical protein
MQVIARTSRRTNSSATSDGLSTVFGYTARDMRSYLSTIGRRLLRWGIAAGGALGFYGLASVAGLSQTLVLIVAFVGALAGSLLALRLTERLFGPEQPPAPPPPRGRGSGRRGASRP